MTKIFTLSILLMIGCNCLGQQASLALNLKKDSTYNLVSNANATIVEDMPTGKQVVTTIISAKVSHKVIAIRDSVYEMEVQYKRISLSLEMGSRRVSFDSDDSLGSNLASKLGSAMINKSFSMFISKTGKVLKVENIDNIYKDLFRNMPEISDDKKAQLTAQMKSSFGEKSIMSNFQDAFAVFPSVALPIGGQWKNDRAIETIVAYRILTTFTLKEVNPNSLIVHGEGVLAPNGKGDYGLVNGFEMRINKISGSAMVDMKLDRATCWVTEGKSSRTVNGTVEIKDTPALPGGMSFPLSVDTDITVTDQ